MILVDNTVLDIPECDIKLVPGMKIKLGRFQYASWIVGYGWYAWGENRPVFGWYLTNEYTKEIKPLYYTDLSDIYVVETAIQDISDN